MYYVETCIKTMAYKLFCIFFCLSLIYCGDVKSFESSLVSAEWLAEHSCDSKVKVIAVSRSKSLYESSHIPCSVYTNFYSDGWRETRNNIPLKLPAPKTLEKVIGSLGVNKDQHVVIYSYGNDKYSIAETTAVYFSFIFLGHRAVSILNGGMDSYTNIWDADIETGKNTQKHNKYIGNPDYSILATYEDVEQIVADNGPLIDMRSNDHYLGINKINIIKEYGTLPGATNLPITWLLKDETANFHSKGSIKNILNYIGVEDSTANTFFCSVGLESSVGWFVMYALLGNKNTRLYDGSLVEWTARSKLRLYRKYVNP